LGEESACPECGLPVRASRDGTPLPHAAPAWLRHLGLACGIEAAAIAALFAYHLVLRFNWLRPEPAGGAPGGHPFPLRTALWIGTDALTFLGAWMLTQPQPQAQAHEPAVSRRKLVRVALVLLLALEIARILDVFSGPSFTYDLLFSLLRMSYLRQLAERLGRPGLSLQIAFAVVGWAVCLTAGRLLPVVFDTLWLMRGHPHGFARFPRSAAAEYGWWAFALYEAALLLVFRRAFLKAAGPAPTRPAAGGDEAGVL
jgi:hypothetical protein